MLSLTTLGLGLALALTAQTGDARTQAQTILDQGAALFDKRDAALIAATYLEDATLALYSRDGDGLVKADVRRGRSAIESGYRDMYRDAAPNTTSRNIVESATFIKPDLLLIQGRFAPDASKNETVAFVQTRTKQGETWRIVDLQLYVGW